MRSLLLLALSLVAILGAGCLENVIIDDISTELTVTQQGAPGEDFEIRKRFRFSRSPEEASAFMLDGGYVALLEPQGADLSFLHRVSVYVVTEDEEEVLAATFEDFEPGSTFQDMTIIWDEDLKDFARSDSRIVLLFQIEPSPWVSDFPEEGLTVLVKASVAIEL